MTAEVVVIGGGVAGLAAASALRSYGREVLVLEASARVGGRVRTLRTASGQHWELGAQVVHGTDNPVWDRVPAGEDFRDGTFSILSGGQRHLLADTGRMTQRSAAPTPWMLSAQLGTLGVSEIRDAGTVSGRLPMDSAATVEEWLSSAYGACSGAAYGWLSHEWGDDPSLLDLQETVTQARSHVRATSQRIPAGGFESLTAELADGVTVAVRTPVRAVQVESRRVVIRTASREIRSEAAILTVPPWVVTGGCLRLTGVPAAVTAGGAALRAADAVVAVITTGAVAPDTQTVFDGDGGIGFARTRQGAPEIQLVAKGPGAAALRAELRHPNRLVERLAAAMPWLRGAGPERIHVADWGADPYIRGAFTVPTRGAGRARAAWRRGAGRLAMAGESTCPASGVARVHGALTSGLAAAAAVDATLGTIRPTAKEIAR